MRADLTGMPVAKEPHALHEKLEQSLGMRDSLLTELAGVAKQAGGKLPPKGGAHSLRTAPPLSRHYAALACARAA